MQTWKNKKREVENQLKCKDASSSCVTDSHLLLKPSKSCQVPAPSIFVEAFVNAFETSCHSLGKTPLTVNCHLS